MAVIMNGYFNPRELEKEIERVEQKLGPEVVRVRHSVGPDHSDEPAIEFRIVLSDSVSGREAFHEVASRTRRILFDELRPQENWGMRLYTSFRSLSEQLERDHLDLDWV